MRQFFRDLWNLITKNKKAIGILLLVLVVVVVVLNITVYQISRHSSTCLYCHYMEPYYKQWQTSTHNKVECIKCHDYSSTAIMGATLRYVSGSYNPRPRVEVSDSSCLQSGCHEKRLLEGKVLFKRAIVFDHKDHLEKIKRGEKLHCTSCHSQIVQGAHISVTEKVCYLCHFKGAAKGESATGCPSCHGVPTKVVEHEGFSFSHDAYLKLGVACKQCHTEVVRGEGEVPDSRCFSCHVERLEKKHDFALIHNTHVNKHKINCFSCHNPIEHGNIAMVGPLEIRCENCHVKQHNIQKQMYMGSGGQGLPDLPSRMFAAQVTCTGCHIHATEKGEPVSGEKRTVAEREACTSCHGKGYDLMLDDWKKEVRKMVADFEPKMNEARKKIMDYQGKVDAKLWKNAKALIDEAYYDFDFVKAGHGQHNVEYAVKLIVAAADRIDLAFGQLDKTYQPIKRDAIIASNDGYCWPMCHQRISFKEFVPYKGKKLPHIAHREAEVGCGSCHSVSKHKQPQINSKRCKDCHEKGM